MTVSRVLAGGKNVRPAKMELVLAAIAELGYRKNENARSIRPGQRTGLIGVIITNVANPYYADLQLGVEEIVTARGFRLLVGNSGEDSARERQLVADFIGRQVDGIILVPSAGEHSHLSPKAVGDIPLVLASRQLNGVHADTIVIDDIAGAFEGTRTLIREGHSRVAFVGNLVSLFTSRRRYEGFVLAHTEAGLDVDEALVRQGQQDPAAAEQAMRELLSLASPPTAVFSANNRNTIGVLRALRSLAAQAGGDGGSGESPAAIRVVGFDNFELADMMPFNLTVIDHDARELGRRAGQMLLDRIGAESDFAPRIVELPTRLIKP